MVSTSKFPFYAKLALVLTGGYVFISILYVSQHIVVPFVYALIISILLNPIVNYLERKKIKRVIAITIAVVIALLFTAGLVYLISSQLSMFNKSLPEMKQKFGDLFNRTSSWISVKFHISPEKINAWVIKTKTEIANNESAIIGQTLITITGLLIVIFLIPVYIFMILYYKPLLLEFLSKLFAKIHQEKVEDVLLQTKTVIQNYLSGLLLEAVIIAFLNSAGLLILGIDYAILLGIIGALLNAIPFIGGIISVAMPITVALLTKNSFSYPVMVLLMYMLIQFIDNHYITPKLVASKVKINALIAVFTVLVGDALWGIPGMFLAIPLTGILKVIFEHIDELKPWAVLLGDDMPGSARLIFNFNRRKQDKPAKQAQK